MTLTLETNDLKELEQILLLVKSLDINIIVPTKEEKLKAMLEKAITKADKTADPRALFGIWKDKNITIEEIREKAWKRKPIL